MSVRIFESDPTRVNQARYRRLRLYSIQHAFRLGSGVKGDLHAETTIEALMFADPKTHIGAFRRREVPLTADGGVPLSLSGVSGCGSTTLPTAASLIFGGRHQW